MSGAGLSFNRNDDSAEIMLVSTERGVTLQEKDLDYITDKVVENKLQERKRRLTATEIVVFLLFLLCYILFYVNYEGWTVLTSMYFIIVSISTVGYGDITPSDNVSRLVTISLICVGIMVIFDRCNNYINNMVENVNEALVDENTLKLNLVHRKKLYIAAGWILLVLSLGTVVFTFVSDQTFVYALYFSVQTWMTVGYGDFNHLEHGTRVFLIFYIILSTSSIAFALNALSAFATGEKRIKVKKKRLENKLDLEFLSVYDGIDKTEFILRILIKLGKISEEHDLNYWGQV